MPTEITILECTRCNAQKVLPNSSPNALTDEQWAGYALIHRADIGTFRSSDDTWWYSVVYCSVCMKALFQDVTDEGTRIILDDIIASGDKGTDTGGGIVELI